MNDVAELKKTKDRSPSFPFVNLERAIERARLFYAQEKRGVAPYTRAVLHWGYTEASSAALQTVSALKSYGLLVEPSGGSGRGRQLQLSDLALRILLDSRPDSVDRLGYIREAARSPTIAAEVYDKWPEHLPSDSTLSHYLVLERRFNEATAPTVIKILKENQQFAQFEAPALLSPSMETVEDRVSENASRLSGLGRGEPPPPINAARTLSALGTAMPAQSRESPEESKASGHVEQLASMDGEVTVSLRFSSKPDADFYEWIAFYASKKAEKMKEAERLAAAQARKANNPQDGNQET